MKHSQTRPLQDVPPHCLCFSQDSSCHPGPIFMTALPTFLRHRSRDQPPHERGVSCVLRPFPLWRKALVLFPLNPGPAPPVSLGRVVKICTSFPMAGLQSRWFPPMVQPPISAFIARTCLGLGNVVLGLAPGSQQGDGVRAPPKGFQFFRLKF